MTAAAWTLAIVAGVMLFIGLAGPGYGKHKAEIEALAEAVRQEVQHAAMSSLSLAFGVVLAVASILAFMAASVLP